MAAATPQQGVRDRHHSTNSHKENRMRSKKQAVVRKPTKKIADTRRVRYGTGSAPAALVRSADSAVADSGAIRFGTGSAPAIFRK
jgi:hypothetical protein